MQRVEVAEAHAEHREVSANRAVQDGHEEERKAQRAAATGAQHPEEVGERRKVGVEWRPRDEDGPLAPHDCDRGDEAHERRDAVPAAGIELRALGACAHSRVRLSRRSTAAVCPQSASPCRRLSHCVLRDALTHKRLVHPSCALLARESIFSRVFSLTRPRRFAQLRAIGGGCRRACDGDGAVSARGIAGTWKCGDGDGRLRAAA